MADKVVVLPRKANRQLAWSIRVEWVVLIVGQCRSLRGIASDKYWVDHAGLGPGDSWCRRRVGTSGDLSASDIEGGPLYYPYLRGRARAATVPRLLYRYMSAGQGALTLTDVLISNPALSWVQLPLVPDEEIGMHTEYIPPPTLLVVSILQVPQHLVHMP